MVVRALLALETHVLLLICVGQTILEDTINERLVSKLGTCPHIWEVVGSVRHALGTGCDNDVRIASDDGLRANNQGLDRRGANLVDRGSDGGLGQTSANGTLAGRVLAEAVLMISIYLGQQSGVSDFADSTFPTKTSSMSSGLRPARSTEATWQISSANTKDQRSFVPLIAWAPSWTADKLERELLRGQFTVQCPSSEFFGRHTQGTCPWEYGQPRRCRQAAEKTW